MHFLNKLSFFNRYLFWYSYLKSCLNFATLMNLNTYPPQFFFFITAQNRDPVDSRTFTRSKKKQALEFLEKLDLLNSERSERTSPSVQLHRRGSDVSSDSLSSCHILEDANDVQEVARMQEESMYKI